VADAFDAMTSDRPYRAGMPAEAAFAEVERMRGQQFDPEIATAFLTMRARVVQEMQSETKKIDVPALTPLRVAR
jgi:HD-GYP domain-containing protein (c-di-GMP phosphodiesterase class II)